MASLQLKATAVALATGFLVPMLFSCRSDYGKVTPEDPPKHGKEQYLRVSIQRPNDVVLRATNSDPMVTMSRLYLLFYDKDTQALKYTREVSVASTKELSNANVKLLPGDYLLVALANPTEKILGLVNVGAPLSNLTSGQSFRSDDFISADGSIVMSNDQGAIAVAKSNFVESTKSTPSTPISIKLEPTLARVLVYGTPTLTGGNKGTGDAKYRVTNIIKQSTILRQLNKLSNGTLETQGDNSPREDRYAKSTVWDAWLASLPITTDEVAAYTQAQLSITNMSARVLTAASDFKSVFRTQRDIYPRESVVPDNAQRSGLIPCVIIAYPYIPKGLTLSAGEGWLSFEGRYYTETEVRSMIRTNSVQPASLKQVITDNAITEQKLSDSHQGLSVGGLNFYYKGYSYYSVFVQHFPSASKEQPYGRFGLVRGNEYHINITEISAPGEPMPPVFTNKLDPIAELQYAPFSASVPEPAVRTQTIKL